MAESDLERVSLSREGSNLPFEKAKIERKIFRVIVWELEEAGALAPGF